HRGGEGHGLCCRPLQRGGRRDEREGDQGEAGEDRLPGEDGQDRGLPAGHRGGRPRGQDCRR
ncbi:unnamed protein product, partial [Heterosigma akashiwo]